MGSPLLDSPLLTLQPVKVKKTNTNNNVRESRLVGGVHYKIRENHAVQVNSLEPVLSCIVDIQSISSESSLQQLSFVQAND